MSNTEKNINKLRRLELISDKASQVLLEKLRLEKEKEKTEKDLNNKIVNLSAEEIIYLKASLSISS